MLLKDGITTHLPYHAAFPVTTSPSPTTTLPTTSMHLPAQGAPHQPSTPTRMVSGSFHESTPSLALPLSRNALNLSSLPPHRRLLSARCGFTAGTSTTPTLPLLHHHSSPCLSLLPLDPFPHRLPEAASLSLPSPLSLHSLPLFENDLSPCDWACYPPFPARARPRSTRL